MKRVKIFLASSAELDEDKILFDLFIGEKNKVYRERYIDFELRTWKDFVSAISLTRLQDEYNSYIKRCDIVVFLFHTKVGQFTLEEFEIAHQEFIRTKGKRPKIYVYFKDEDNHIEALEQFKQKNISYGHFYDTYSSNDILTKKFDRQLQELENEGFIKPSPIDVKKIIKYVALCVLPLLVLALGYFAFENFSPLHMTVKLDEQIRIEQLPFEGGELTLTYADKTEAQQVKGEVIFKQIASKYKGDRAKLLFVSKGYQTIDTTINLNKIIHLPIQRDNSLGLIFGSVKDEDNIPLMDVKISVQDIIVETDNMGMFRLEIPFQKQKEEQRLTAYKNGYQLWDFTSAPSPTIEWKIILKK